jgi:hypothetical protein
MSNPTEGTGYLAQDDPHKEWVGMPEYVQPKSRPYKTLIVRFATQEDYLDFERRIEQPLTKKSKSIWHPKLQRGLLCGQKYFDANEPTVSDIRCK